MNSQIVYIVHVHTLKEQWKPHFPLLAVHFLPPLPAPPPLPCTLTIKASSVSSPLETPPTSLIHLSCANSIGDLAQQLPSQTTAPPPPPLPPSSTGSAASQPCAPTIYPTYGPPLQSSVPMDAFDAFMAHVMLQHPLPFVHGRNSVDPALMETGLGEPGYAVLVQTLHRTCGVLPEAPAWTAVCVDESTFSETQHFYFPSYPALLEHVRSERYQNKKRVQARKRATSLAHAHTLLAQTRAALPTAAQHGHRILCLDIEAYEFDHRKLTEIGLTLFDGVALHSHHVLVLETWHLRNGVRVQDAKFRFLGISTTLPQHVLLARLAQLFAQVPMVVGHALQSDLLFLKRAHPSPAWTLPAHTVDTQTLFKAVTGRVECSRLSKVLDHLAVPYVPTRLHNAGNDALYTCQAFLKMMQHGTDCPVIFPDQLP